MSLTLLVGQIGCGKSTWIKNNITDNTLVVNDDAIVNALHANKYGLYNKNLKGLYKSIEHLIIGWGLSNGYDVVIDRPNLNPNTRRRYIELAKSYDCEDIRAVVFPIVSAEEAAHRRFKYDSRGNSYEQWLQASEYQLNNYKPVELKEGFSEIQYK